MSQSAVLNPASEAPAASVSLSTLAWVAASLMFIALRFGPTWQPPENGAELLHLSGALQAAEGKPEDERFVPTLYQAASAVLIDVDYSLLPTSVPLLGYTLVPAGVRDLDSSTVPARALAFLATATIPLALWLLRGQLGNAGALLALVLLSFDAPGILLGASASALGFDLAVTAWLAVALARGRLALPLVALLSFLVATAGPIPLTLASAAGALWLLRREPFRPGPRVAAAVASAAAGVLLASLAFGFGTSGFAIPPLSLFAAGYEETWTTMSALDVALIYSWPLLLFGFAAAADRVAVLARREPISRFDTLLLAWLAVSLLWWLSMAGEGNPAPVAALTLPLALLLGPATSRAINAMVRAEWLAPAIAIGLASFLFLIVFQVMIGWARVENVGEGREVAVVSGLVIFALAALAYVAFDSFTAPALTAVGLVIGAIGLVSATFGVALSGEEEPLLSPRVAKSADQLAYRARESNSSGPVVVHPTLAESATWPLRDVDYTTAAQIPAGASLAIWPETLPQPEGMVPLEGNWAFTETVSPPTEDLLDWLHWATDRNSLAVTPQRVAVYVRPSQ